MTLIKNNHSGGFLFQVLPQYFPPYFTELERILWMLNDEFNRQNTPKQ